MMRENGPVHDDQQQPRTDQSGKHGNDAEIPYMAGRQTCGARGMLRQQKSRHHAQCCYCAIRRDQDGADLKKNGMHLRSGYGICSPCAGQRVQID